MFDVRFYGRSDVGRRRTTNEDSYALCEDEGMGMVCDGMGGHERGEIASRTAVEIFSERVSRAWSTLNNPRLKLSKARAMAQDLIVQWTQQANAEIHRMGNPDGKTGFKQRMGTTLALVLFVSDFVVVAHVGDSRIYRLRNGAIQQLTEDHVIQAEAKRHPADPRPPRMRKYVTRSLGTKPSVRPDVQLFEAEADDIYVLCSDGLSDLVDETEIAEVVERCEYDLRQAARALIDLANKRGGNDNVTVVLGEVLDDEDDDDTEAMVVRRR